MDDIAKSNPNEYLNTLDSRQSAPGFSNRKQSRRLDILQPIEQQKKRSSTCLTYLTYLKVLLTKDYLTLWRNKGFLVAFLLMPIILMFSFVGLEKSILDVNGEFGEGSMISAYFQYTTNNIHWLKDQKEWAPGFFGDIGPYNKIQSIKNCMIPSLGIQKYNFTKIAIVSPNSYVRGNASIFFKDYVYKVNQFQDYWDVDEFESMDDLFDSVNRSPNQSYCFGLNLIPNTVDIQNDIYDLSVEFSFNKGMIPDTNSPPYDPNVMSPDIAAFGEYVQTAAAVYPYITEFIGRFIKMNIMNDTLVMNQTQPFFNQTVAYAPMTTQKYIKMNPEASKNLSTWYPFFVMVIELIPFYYLCSKLSSEKENKSREGMRMMGLPMSMYYLSVFIFYLSIAIVTSFIVTIITVNMILKKVEFGLFFFFFLVYSLSFFGVAFVITSILPTKRSSSVASTLFHIVSYYMSFAIMDPATASSIQYSLSLFSNLCMNQCVKQFFWQNLNTYNGARWKQINIMYQGYSLRTGLQILVLDCIFGIFLGLYLDQVVPSQFGSVKKWNFLCQKCKKKERDMTVTDDEKGYQMLEDDFDTPNENPNFERVSDMIKQQESDNQCLKIRGLRKVFGEKIAVHNTNITMYTGQIFALLGHNGAGKTTTISMLTGLIQPTEGHAFINGSDIFKDMEQLRKVLGVCPQHNVLFDYLTPLDHLRLFATFKGVDPAKQEGQIQQMLQDIELVPQKDQLVSTLSGGQKRKLSVAIALIGDSKLVMLDEPTSGMDTTSRRKLWDMLKKYKQNRIIILTTHYMDEADILGDRIGIMAEGRVVCIGSSLFLKRRFGVGYNLVISKKSKSPSPQIDNFVNSYLDDVQKMQEVSKEIQYQIPTSSSSQFKAFFEQFDQQLEKLGIKSYGVGITTLEEVFLKIGHGEFSDHKGLTMNKQGNSAKNSVAEHLTTRSVNDTEDSNRTQSLAQSIQEQQQALEASLEEFSVSNLEKNCWRSILLFFLHLRVLLKKRLLMMVRDRKTLIIDLLFPLLLIFAGLFLTSTSFYVQQEPRNMSPIEIYPTPMKLYSNQIALGYPKKSSLSESQIEDFYRDFIIANDSNFEYMGPISNIKGAFEDDYPQIIQSLEEYDKNIYNQVIDHDSKHDKEVLYGQMYLQKLHDQHGYPDYQIACIVNSTSRAAVGSWGSYVHEVMLRKFLVESLQNQTYRNVTPEFAKENFKLKFINRPFPLSKQFEGLNKTFSGTNSALLMAIAWMMISESVLRTILKEKKNNIKHQILVSGGSLTAYWLANYIADIFFHTLAATLAVFGSYMFSIGIEGIYQLFILLVFANPLFLYFLTFFFETEEGGSFAINIIYFLFGIIGPISISVLQVVSQDLFNTAQNLRWFFYPVPIFSLTYGYMSIINIDLISYMMQTQSQAGEQVKQVEIWDSNVAGPSFYFLQLMSPFFLLMIVLFEAKFFQLINKLICSCRRRKETFAENLSALHYSHQLTTQESLINGWKAAQKKLQIELNQSDFSRMTGFTNLTDKEQKDLHEYQNLDELQQEEINIENAPIASLPVRVHKLRKTYGEVVAVDKVSFGLEYGECFALLGVSGAGKTNCFKCLTGEVQPTSGQVTINGNDVSTPKGFQKSRQQIGYCPQFDTIFDGLTVKEHLEIYAALKGIPQRIRDQLIMKQIRDMDLDQFVNVKVETLSGGNKRKVSMSIAIIGNPPIVFLDEPSTGVDPQAKRFMWNVIAKISSQSKKSAVIITTHAMEEAEALCSKMGIMVAGSFRCFGSSQYIKDKYGTGYEIEFKIENLTDNQISNNIKELGFRDTKFFGKKDCVDVLKVQGRSMLINQVCLGGIGEHFYKRLVQGLQVNSNEFMRWQHNEFYGEQVLNLLETKFSEVEELEHYGSSWKIKTSKDDLSIGYIFGMFEDLKGNLNISEYSVNQTTLEQIFNNFATEKERTSSRISVMGSQIMPQRSPKN